MKRFAAMLLAVAFGGTPARGEPPQFGDEKTIWHGFDRYDFLMDESDFTIKPYKAGADEGNAVKTPVKGFLRCVVVAPKNLPPATRGPGGATTSTTSHMPKSSCSSGASTLASSGATPASRGTVGTTFLLRSTGSRRSRRSSA